MRHGRSVYNDLGLLNGDPALDVPLTEQGITQCRAVAQEIAGIPFDLAVCTPFPRTAQSLAVVLDGRVVPTIVIADLGDIRLGDFEGREVNEYRMWRHGRPLGEDPPGGGESRLEVLGRYARGYAKVMETSATHVLCVVHDITIRMLINAINGDDPVDGPVRHVDNCVLYRYDAQQMRDGIRVMRARAASDG